MIIGAPSQPRVHLGAQRLTLSGMANKIGMTRASTPGQNYSVGNRFMLAMAARLIGVRFCHKLASEATPETVYAKGYDVNGTLLESKSTSVTASGEVAVYFNAAYAIPAWTAFTIAVYNTTNAYPKWALSGAAGAGIRLPDIASADTGGFCVQLGAGVMLLKADAFALGDVYPNSENTAATQMFATDPILDD